MKPETAKTPEKIKVVEPMIVFCHLRWDFVLQRPQHLMRRFAQNRSVYIFEEPIPTDHPLPYLEHHSFSGSDVTALRPRIPEDFSDVQQVAALKAMLDRLLSQIGCKKPLLWFYTPMMWPIADHVVAEAIVYDCMDELSAFKFAPPQLKENEAALLQAADVVFTGGYSIWEAKRAQHDNIHPYPSSVDVAFFRTARTDMPTPADQRDIPTPRLGFYGVIDERLDLALLKRLATEMPEVSIVMLGPVLKISEDDLPRLPNIHYLGQKDYHELPAYLAGWNVALMPFAISDATRYISPTKTPEYLASGRPVVSTSIRDVVRHYGDLQAVTIAENAAAFVEGCKQALNLPSDRSWLQAADAKLSLMSWDTTYLAMQGHIQQAVARKVETAANDRFWAPGRRRRSGQAYDVVIVGAGFAGAVLAERLAEGSGKRVLVCDKRNHIAGNAYDHRDRAGILIHKYGPHVFHTNSQEIVRYLSRFTEWRPYEHRVLAELGDHRLPIPINRVALNAIHGLELKSDDEAAAFLASKSEPIEDIRTAEDSLVRQVGRELYETFFKGYIYKHWGLDARDLDESAASHISIRTSADDRYFLDSFQAMPLHGYTRMFECMLDHKNIDLALGTDYSDLDPSDSAPLTVYTGRIDEYFGYCFGKLPYRSLDFVHETLGQRVFQEVGVMTYPKETVPYTRITEYKHLTGQVHPLTSISYEYSKADGDPFYPIPRAENHLLYRRYEALGQKKDCVVFAGRLGTYRNYSMDQVVGQALSLYRQMAPRLAPAGTGVFAAT